MDLQTPLSKLAGIGFTYAKRLEYLGLFTASDLINHYPFRYDDFSNVSSALDAQIGQKVTLQGEIWSIKNIYTRSRRILTQAIFNDGTSPILLTWFNSSWLTKQLATGDRVQISGKLTKYKNKLTIIAPAWEKISLSNHLGGVKAHLRGEMLHTGRLVPVYPETYGVSSKWLRTKIDQILPKILTEIQDPLPEKIIDSMLPLHEALKKIHFPDSWQDVEKARERLGFDELFYVALATQKIRADWQKKVYVATFEVKTQKLDKFIKSLPFKLTSAQKRVIDEIIADLKKGFAMNRLVQGEVGSGKTVVATIVAYLTYLNKLKTLYMAPTEILAFQHFETLQELLNPFGISVGIYTGSKKKVKNADVFVGTHALLSDKLAAPDVGLVIIDEQQRFGVEQRSLLRGRAKVPHFLTMTATPIPRTVALTLYGDLDLSIIDEMPVGRKPVKTYVVPEKKRQDAYQFIEDQVYSKRSSAYIITPLIEPSETFTTVRAAKVEFEKLKSKVFPKLKLGLLHGRLKSKEKEQVIKDFKDHRIDILVSTSVVEVGMDIPNATIMVIEGAERFGLAQLHQLRGRVGRGEKESFCLLFSEDKDSTSRLKNLERLHNGLALAELDLKIRGSGEIFGQRQSGRFEFKIASLSDLNLVEKTRQAAKEILNEDPSLDKFPLLRAQYLSISGTVMPD